MNKSVIREYYKIDRKFKYNKADFLFFIFEKQMRKLNWNSYLMNLNPIRFIRCLLRFTFDDLRSILP